MSNPCQCLFDHEAAMRNLLNLLRNNQMECTDTECPTEGLQNPANLNTVLMWAMMWALAMIGLFVTRPNSMRSRQRPENNEKPGPSGDNTPPPPPPPTVG